MAGYGARAGSLLGRRLTAVIITVAVTGGILIALPLAVRPAGATPTPVTLETPSLVRSNGADLAWTRYVQATGEPAFDAYEVHRSDTNPFTPDASTRLTTIEDHDTLHYTDSTAAPGRTFYYKVRVAGVDSLPLAVTTEPDGYARATLQPGPSTGRATFIRWATAAGSTCPSTTQWGGAQDIRIGSSRSGSYHRSLLWFDTRRIPPGAAVTGASLTLNWDANANTPSTNTGTALMSMARSWTEGNGGGGCGTGKGATWLEAAPGVPWAVTGADTITTLATQPAKDRRVAGVDTFTGAALTSTVQQWINGDLPNFGFMVKLTNETLPSSSCTQPCEKWWDYDADDSTTAARRPKLVVTYQDNAHAVAPTVAITSPSPSAINRSQLVVTAEASDDRRVESVEFQLSQNGVPETAIIDFDAPYSATIDRSWVTSDTTYTLTAKATDDAGNQSQVASQNVRVWNAPAPSVAITSPANNQTVSGNVVMQANATAAAGVKRVEFYRGDSLIGEDTSAPYTATWATANQEKNSYDGPHQLTAKVVDQTDAVATVTQPVNVTVANTPNTKYRAGFELRKTGTTTGLVPDLIIEKAARDGNGQKAHVPSAMSAPPQSNGAEGNCSDDSMCFDVRVTNNSTTTWPANELRLWARWYDEDGQIVFEGPANNGYLQSMAPNDSRVEQVKIQAPGLPYGGEAADYRLRLDLWDDPVDTWFAARGNPPVDQPVRVIKDDADRLGIEHWWAYDQADVGAGMQHLVNVSNGNSLLHWMPFNSPGNGLSTVVGLTYNSLEEHSDSVAGNNFSLTVSGLTRLGERLDVHPNTIDGNLNKVSCWIAFRDGDGTLHRFVPTADDSGCTKWKAPDGVHLHLRREPGTSPTRGWLLSRPDRTTFKFDVDGYPVSVTDRNGNTLSFTLSDVPPADDPGGEKKRVTRVTDQGGRFFDIQYWSRADARTSHVRGRVKSILDHSGSPLEFEYYDDGNLRRMRQRRGVDVIGEAAGDRVFTFTYTTPSASGAAIPAPADRVDPDPRTPSQSTRLFSVRDPRGKETTFDYYFPPEGQPGQDLRWRLESRTDRRGDTTGYAYNPTAGTTTVSMPLSRTITWTYDSLGRPTDRLDPLGRHVYRTWWPNNKTQTVSDPTTGSAASAPKQSFEYNGNGLLTKSTNQDNEVTILDYQDSAPTDQSSVVSQSDLVAMTPPKGAAHNWTFGLDAKGNVTSVVAPKVAGEATGPTWTFVLNADGTINKTIDPHSRETLYGTNYHASGQPTRIQDAAGGVTRIGYDADGQVAWMQDANHEVPGRDPANDPNRADYTTVFEYDELHQLVRSSKPKSTKYDRGTLIWTRQAYDASGNAVRTGEPRFGGRDPGWGDSSVFAYDDLDRLVSDRDPSGDTSTVEYDAGGRATKTRSPMAATTPSIADDYTTIIDYDTADRVVRTTRHEMNTAGVITNTMRVHQCYEVDDDLARVVHPNANVATVDCANPATAAQWSTTFTYDPAHRVLRTTDPEGRFVETGYDDHGNVITQKDAAGTVATTDYDERDQRVRETVPFDTGRNVVTQWRYDRVGNLVKLIPPRASDAAPAGTEPVHFTTEYLYDEVDRLVRVKEPTSATETEAAYSHIVRDKNGQEVMTALPSTAVDVSSVPDQAKTVITRFDPGWVRSTDDPTLPAMFFDYTARGQQAERTPAVNGQPGVLDVNQTMLWRFRPDGLLSSIHDRTGQLSRFLYNADGQTTEAVDSSGLSESTEKARQVYSTFDGFGRLTRTDHKRSSETSYKVTEYGFDLDGNILTRNDDGTAATLRGVATGASRNVFTYDRAGRPRTQLDLGTATTCTGDRRIRRDFTPNGWEKERVIESSTATTCVNDAANTAFSPRQTTTWTHFLNGKTKTLQTADRAGLVVESHTVGYLDGSVYVNGHRTSDAYTLKGPGATVCNTTACTATYQYNAREKLVSYNDGHGGTSTYTFDEPTSLNAPTLRAGNLTTEVEGGITRRFTYDGVRTITMTAGSTSHRYWYEANGNIDCITTSVGSVANCSPQDGETVSSNLSTDYAYDGLDRLVASRVYTASAVNRSASFVYDALDRTVKETEKVGSSQSRTTTFSYQGLTSLVSSEQLSTNNGGLVDSETRRYGYDTAGIRMTMNRTLNGVSAGYSYGYDVHGSTSLLIDEAAAAGGPTVKASYGYKPYGAADTALTKGDTDAFNQINPYRFSAKRFDIGSQTHDMGARRMSSVTGRFLQGDRYYGAMSDLSLGTDPLSQNRYALAGGNPISYTEWDGHVVVDDGCCSSESYSPPPLDPCLGISFNPNCWTVPPPPETSEETDARLWRRVTGHNPPPPPTTYLSESSEETDARLWLRITGHGPPKPATAEEAQFLEAVHDVADVMGAAGELAKEGGKAKHLERVRKVGKFVARFGDAIVIGTDALDIIADCGEQGWSKDCQGAVRQLMLDGALVAVSAAFPPAGVAIAVATIGFSLIKWATSGNDYAPMPCADNGHSSIHWTMRGHCGAATWTAPDY